MNILIKLFLIYICIYNIYKLIHISINQKNKISKIKLYFKKNNFMKLKFCYIKKIKNKTY